MNPKSERGIKMRSKLLILTIILVLVLSGCGGNTATKTLEIKTAEDWKDQHTDIYASYMSNSEMVATTFGGSVPIDYLEKYPELRSFYDGYGFSIEYLRARGHVYALEDVIHTKRPQAAASCFACKSPDYLKLVTEEGTKAHSMTFEEATPRMSNTISCYDCHENTPGVINISRGHFTTGLTHLEKEFKPKDMVCGQCHVEYYLAPDTKEVTLPWHNGLGTDGMIQYFDSIEYSDWIHPTTNSPLLKAQHPEFETFNGSLHAGFNLSCTDCHMPQLEGESGGIIKSHHWTSPLKTVEQSCLGCHQSDTSSSLIARVEGVQAGVEQKMNEASLVIQELISELERETITQTVSNEILDEARYKHRVAQFKWDFVFVENSEGFHNKALALKELEDAIRIANEGIDLIK